LYRAVPDRGDLETAELEAIICRMVGPSIGEAASAGVVRELTKSGAMAAPAPASKAWRRDSLS